MACDKPPEVVDSMPVKIICKVFGMGENKKGGGVPLLGVRDEGLGVSKTWWPVALFMLLLCADVE